MTTPRPGWLLLLPVFLGLLGCGGGGDGKPVETESDAVAQFIREFHGQTVNPTWFAATFAKGSAPAEAQRPRYTKHTYGPGKVTVSGDTATIRVKVCDERYEKVLSEQDWTVVKEGGQWKLKTAPLP